eukprot:4995208-Prymnesium_polylepis.3
MTSSAPLHSSMYGPPCASRTSIDMRFRSDENSLIANTRRRLSAPPTLIMMKSRPLETNSYPISFAAATSAPSSGEAAWYRIEPSVSTSAKTLWHVLMIVQKSSIAWAFVGPSCCASLSRFCHRPSLAGACSIADVRAPADLPAVSLSCALASCPVNPTPPMEHLRNAIWFCVSVPVLSVNT